MGETSMRACIFISSRGSLPCDHRDEREPAHSRVRQRSSRRLSCRCAASPKSTRPAVTSVTIRPLQRHGSLLDKVIYLPGLGAGDESGQRMKIENAVPYLGGLVTGLDVKRMTDGEWKTLYQTWLDRHVLIVRGQELSKADFLAYSRRFGRLKPHMIKHTRDPEHPEITLMGVTSMAKDSKGEKLILDRGQAWHTDSP